MSARSIQIEHVLEEATKIFYATGVRPPLTQILQVVSRYFSQYPAGQPLPVRDIFVTEDGKSNVENLNEALLNIVTNLAILYEVSQEQIADIMGLNTTLRSKIDQLDKRRKSIQTRIDDYMLSLYNSDGYYFSIGEPFSDLSLTDLTYTSAYVDTTEGVLRLPTIGSLTTRLKDTDIGRATVRVTHNGTALDTTTIADWSGAIDGLTNTIWAVEVGVDTPGEVVATVDFDIGAPEAGVEISTVRWDPHGITGAQYFMEYAFRPNQELQYEQFGSKIITTSSVFTLIASPPPVEKLRLTIRKTEPDYIENVNDTAVYKYVFGCRDLAITAHTYDTNATYVSVPLSPPSELAEEITIDAVSLVADYDTPYGTDLRFYVARETGTEATLADYSWRRIEPLDRDQAGAVIRFNGATRTLAYIKDNPDVGDLQRIAFDNTNSDLTKRNPSPTIISGVDVYRLAKFEENFFPNSVEIQEGVNTVRIYHTDYDTDAVNGLEFWASAIPDLTPVYGRIDTGNDFFYGGDVGESGRSVYIETYIDIPDKLEPVLAELRKTNANAQQWDVRVLLNGRDIGYLPYGTDKAVIPWTFVQGLNHIALLVNIPASSSAYPHAYIGTLDLMGDLDLYEFGLVRLALWNYVDFFDMTHNEINQPFTFTIRDGEIISRRRPTTNLRLSYASPTNDGPDSLRFRVDLSRKSSISRVSPSVDFYRLRFSYGE